MVGLERIVILEQNDYSIIQNLIQMKFNKIKRTDITILREPNECSSC